MSRSSLCNYSDAYITVHGTITITRAGADDAAKRLDIKGVKRTKRNKKEQYLKIVHHSLTA